jgi:hypothetical protein
MTGWRRSTRKVAEVIDAKVFADKPAANPSAIGSMR